MIEVHTAFTNGNTLTIELEDNWEEILLEAQDSAGFEGILILPNSGRGAARINMRHVTHINYVFKEADDA